MTRQWFDVDRAGLGKQAEEHGKGRLIGELVQNALDEPGVTRIEITLALVPGRRLADLTVEDDSPEGFRDLSHAYTLFAESYKRVNPRSSEASTTSGKNWCWPTARAPASARRRARSSTTPPRAAWRSPGKSESGGPSSRVASV